ncbi:MAG TPA: hypothetical protein VJ624_03485 [Thermodesulfobacteriota bacterium]|nr:hypothetical protein [Thermodesulfobacteriota bacterium]
MVLTNKEKRAFILPVCIALLLVGLVVYNGHTSSQNQEIQALLEKTKAQIRTDQETVTSLKEFKEKEKLYFHYRLDDWIPLFQNPLELQLYLTKKITSSLDAVGAKGKDLTWVTSEHTSRQPLQNQFVLDVLFPSYTALMSFLEEVEKNKPPLLIQKVEIKKADIKLEVSLTMSFAFRLKDDAI